MKKLAPLALIALTACTTPQLTPDEMKRVATIQVYQDEAALKAANPGRIYKILGEASGRNGTKVPYYPLLPMKTPPLGPALDEAKAAAIKLGAEVVILKEVKEIGVTLTSWKDLECTLIAVAFEK